jgi:peptidoglycan-N-acetylglucosamine deacetylase
MRLLTFDIEEWFQLLDNEKLANVSSWNVFESRIEKNVDRILEFLDNNQLNATFFCLGWIGKKYPHIINKISNCGYEIGSHTTNHSLIYKHTPKSFKKDLNESLDILSNITGKKIKYFRAPGFSIRETEFWAFEIIAESGIEIDCSVFPALRSHGGLSNYGYSGPSIIKYRGIELKELPISVYNLLNHKLVFSGGGYFRLFPYQLIKKMTKSSDYVMTYFHPRDFDSDQPVIEYLSKSRKFKSYVGINNALTKLNKWVSDFEFIDIKEANKIINWEQVKRIELMDDTYSI